MSLPTQVLFTGPLIPYAHGFARELIKQGYRPHAATHQLRLIHHLSRWLAARDLDARNLTPPILETFLTARRREGYTFLSSPQALMPFLKYLRDCGYLPVSTEAEESPTQGLLARYHRYLLEARGLAESSAHEYVGIVHRFVAARTVDGQLDWTRLTRADVAAFMRSACRRRSTSSARLLATALRSLLGYLHIEGLICSSLTVAVPAVAGSKLAGLPRALEVGDLERLLAACRMRTPTVRRDFAILTLLARLGLRAGEVRALSLDDIDWRAGELIVRGKGNRIERLPLPQDVGAAIAAYLRDGRPSTAQDRTIFVRIRAPHRALTGIAITHVVKTAALRAGLTGVTPHRLRHTVATQMIRAGVPLPEIGQVLRHRRLLTTAIYAKVDREGLRQLARVWPGVTP